MVRVLQEQSWHFDHQVIVLAHIPREAQPSSIPLTHVPYWVRVYDLPLGGYNQTIAQAIGNTLRTFVNWDDSGDTVGNFLCVRTLLDVRSPLPRKRTFKFQGGDVISVFFKIENVQSFCYLCGCLGHLDKDCELADEEDVLPPSGNAFGTWLRASPFKPQNHAAKERPAYHANATKRSLFTIETPQKACMQIIPMDDSQLIEDVHGLLIKIGLLTS